MYPAIKVVFLSMRGCLHEAPFGRESTGREKGRVPRKSGAGRYAAGVILHAPDKIALRSGNRGTSLTRNSAPLGLYGRTMPRALGWS